MPLSNSVTDRLSLEIDKLLPGDPREFQKLFGLYYRDFVEEARELLADKNKAPELVRHSFIKLWLKCSVLDPGQYFAFLRTSVNTHCYNYNANNLKRHSPEQQDILNGIILGLVCDGQNRQTVYAEICASSPEQKVKAGEAYEKLYVRGLPVSVIATEMGLSENETREMLNLAFKTLYLILSLKQF